MKKAIDWSLENYSHLPWRKKRSLYRTLVSEIMLQQTTVGTVLNHFEDFLIKYPTIQDLANTTEEQICMSWKGLGYYRRARNLRLAAIEITQNYEGKIPCEFDKLIKIKGIGEYTANALLSIGRNQAALALDANLERIIARLFCLPFTKGPNLQKQIQKKFTDGQIFKDIEKLGPRNVNEALMDVGRVYCQSKKANCDLCPLKTHCQAYKTQQTLLFPHVKESKKSLVDLELARIFVKKGRKVLAYQKSEKEWLSGQWEVPTFVLQVEDKNFSQYPALPKRSKIKSSKTIYKTSITKYKIKNHIFHLTEKEFEKISSNKKYKFVDSDFRKTNFSTSSLKLFKKLSASN